MSLYSIIQSSQVFIGTPNGIVVETIKPKLIAFDDDIDFESTFYEQPTLTIPPTTSHSPLIAVALARKQQLLESRKKQAHWFYDEHGSLRFGKIQQLDANEPLFLLEEEYYNPMNRRLYWLEEPPKKHSTVYPPVQKHLPETSLETTQQKTPAPTKKMSPKKIRHIPSFRTFSSSGYPFQNSSFASQQSQQSQHSTSPEQFYPVSSTKSQGSLQ